MTPHKSRRLRLALVHGTGGKGAKGANAGPCDCACCRDAFLDTLAPAVRAALERQGIAHRVSAPVVWPMPAAAGEYLLVRPDRERVYRLRADASAPHGVRALAARPFPNDADAWHRLVATEALEVHPTHAATRSYVRAVLDARRRGG